ncbi:MAG: alanine--tRNA ligase, partial [candidate division Zixibacteria bacterium]|nr:alanine--tRNA ligase [candidate division Zixibacteria bacterium]
MKTSEIRQSFIDFFKNDDHKVYPSSPVIPFDDPTIMFTNAGMNQFKDIFTGKKRAEHPRAVSSQKCMRAGGKHNDLENVGRTGRHHTFFEMLGNFSFGDYFKEAAIKYCWDWVTKEIKLPKDKLYVSVYREDDEAFSLWEKIAPELKGGRVMRFDKKDNFWSMGEVGPCGPSSEIHFDRGEKYGTGPDAVVNGESDRFVEFWNLVFMQFDQKPDGSVVPLPKPSVDTGAGLERLACIIQNAESNYEIDLFRNIISHVAEISGKNYYTDDRGISHRVIADHVRALTFCIADGGGLSNEKQGYVLRRILRRAARHGRLLEIEGPFIHKLVPTLVDLMGDVYPEIKARQEHVENVIKSEEESFGRTLDSGLMHFDDIVKTMRKDGKKTIAGEDVFRLYDTYGFPADLTQIMAEENGLTLDMAGFEKAMAWRKDLSRSASNFDEGDRVFYQNAIRSSLDNNKKAAVETVFVRKNFEIQSDVVAAIPFHYKRQNELGIITHETPFYVEAGGQISDWGTIQIGKETFIITLLLKQDKTVVHICDSPASIKPEDITGKPAILSIDTERRWDIMRHHTATHLLHAALRKVLGDHVYQSGSYVGPDKLRFDFSHFKPMTPEELTEVERIVNEQILKGKAVHTKEEDIETAKQEGAMAIFGEKYDSRVRVVTVDEFSKELCGGTHVDNIAQIGPFLITLETGIAAGVRR